MKIDELINSPKQVNLPTDKDSDAYKNKRSAHVNEIE